MALSIPPRKYVWPVLIVPLIVTGLAWLVAGQAAWLDREVMERLLALFGGTPPAADAAAAAGSKSLTTLAQSAVILIFAAASTWSGFRLSAVPRLLVLVQLFVLALLAVVALSSWAKLPGHPLAYFTAVFLGCCCGYGLRLKDLRQRKQEAQYYELLLRNKELNETKLQLVKQDEVERRMLAADLHDQVLNDLKAVRQKLDSYMDSPEPGLADSIKSLLNQAMDEIREVMDSLCPSALEHLGLSAAIEDCLRRGAEKGGFKTRFKSKLTGDEFDCLSLVEQSLLYRLVQESITNVCKHAGATLVRGAVEMENDQIVLRVSDNGRGIDPSKLRDDSRGVRYMRQRADLIGATIAWRSGDDGKGTTVEIRMSLSGRKDGQSSSS